MARYDLYRLGEQAGYLLDVQTDLIDVLQTRVVVPLLPAGSTPAARSTAEPGLQYWWQAAT